MRGIYFINEGMKLNGLSIEESIELQEKTLLDFIHSEQIQIVKLNPYQLNSHYTILHALLHDLKSTNEQLDCFAYFSEEVLDDFILTYPARWLMISSYFDNMLPVLSSDPSRRVV